MNEAIGVGQRVAQDVQGLAQIRTSLWFTRVGPEQEREALTGMGGMAIDDQVGKKRLQPG